MKQTLQSPTGDTANIRAIFRTLCMAALLLLTAGVFLCALGPSRALRAAAVPEDKMIKSPRSIGSWLDEAFECVVKIEDGHRRRAALIAVAEVMDKPFLEKNFARIAAEARGLKNALYGKQVMVAVMKAQARAGMYDEACKTLMQIGDNLLIEKEQLYIVEQQARAGLYVDALNLYLSFDRLGRKREAIVVVVRVMAGAGEYERAIKLADTLEEQSDRVQALVDIGKAYFAAGDVDSCKKTFEAAEKLTRDTRDSSQENNFYAVAMARAEAGLWQDALKTVQLMRRSHYHINNVLDIIIRHAIEEKMYDTALQAARLYRLGHEKALGVLDIAMLLIQAGQGEAAKKSIAEAKALYEKSGHGDLRDRIKVLADIAKVMKLAGMDKESEQLFAELTEIADKNNCRDSNMKSIVRSKAGAGMFAEAVEISLKEDTYRRIWMLEAIAECLVKAGKLADAEKAGAEAEKALEELKNDPNKKESLDLASQGVSMLYRCIAEAKLDAGEPEKALEYLSKIPHISSAGRLVIAVARHYTRAGKTEDAAKTYLKALETAYACDCTDHSRDKIVAEVANDYVELGMFEQAIIIARRMTRPHFRLPLMANIGERMAATARIEDVVKHYERNKVMDPELRAWYCIGVAHGLAGVKQPENFWRN